VLVERLIAAHPQIPARLLVGDDRISDNPKLNNIVKGWRAASHDWIAIADSNVLMPSDYIQRLFARWKPGTGLVCSPPVGCLPESLAAELECAFLNTYQTRWQSAADGIGFGFAQGKTLFWWRPVLERAGGLRALAAEPAEDAASTKLVRGQGLRVRIVDAPFGQPLGMRSFTEVWRRQVRWARLRRSTFPLLYALEILSTGVGPLVAVPLAAAELGYSPWSALVAVASLWYGAEALLAYSAAWHLTIRSPLVWLLRDLAIPVLWIEGWRASGFSWRGHDMTAAAGAHNA
jgi:ceramide glucosyltransferase